MKRQKSTACWFRKDQKGGVLAVTAITLPLLVAVMTLTIDLGLLYDAKTKTSNAAVAAAEAAYQQLPNTSQAQLVGTQVANEMMANTDFIASKGVNVSATSTKVTVKVSAQLNTFLAGLMGKSQTSTFSIAVRPIDTSAPCSSFCY